MDAVGNAGHFDIDSARGAGGTVVDLISRRRHRQLEVIAGIGSRRNGQVGQIVRA